MTYSACRLNNEDITATDVVLNLDEDLAYEAACSVIGGDTIGKGDRMRPHRRRKS
jgi:hypothetical protein